MKADQTPKKKTTLITTTQAFASSDGRAWSTPREAQQAELTRIMPATLDISGFATFLLDNAETIIDILSFIGKKTRAKRTRKPTIATV